MEKGWSGLPFRPISEFYKEKFGEKVYKLPVSIVDDCPNRRGLKGMQTCVFCDVWGSAARADAKDYDLVTQIERYKALIGPKFKTESFLVYFQAYTNTFAKLDSLREAFQTATQFDFVKGLVVGTRPDCLSKGVLELWQEFHEKKFVAVELGVQSFFDDDLLFLRRGHDNASTLKAISRISKETQVDLGIHLIFGSPNETDDRVIETAKIVNDLPITNVKLHNLHVLTNTPLEKMYREGKFQPIEFEPYARRVQLFLEHLSPRIFVHRLAAFSSRFDELVAPIWTKDKMRTHQGIIDHLRAEHSFQSRQFSPVNEHEIQLKNDLVLKGQPLNLSF